MSLRDQLVKSGLVSKKRAKQAERELKTERKLSKSQRKKKRQREREAAAAADAAREQALAEARQRRLEHDEAKAQVERALRIRNLVAGNRQRAGRGQRFWHRALDGTTLVRTEVSSGVASQLRSGELAIGALDHGTRVEYVVIPARSARTLLELSPRVVVFFVQDTEGISEPDEGFLPADLGEPSLQPHRATPADLERLGAATRAASPGG